MFEIEQATEEYCKNNNKSIVILGLPVARSELNEIELIQANVQEEVARKNETLKMKDVKILMEKSWQTLQWKNGCTGEWIFLHRMPTVPPLIICESRSSRRFRKRARI